MASGDQAHDGYNDKDENLDDPLDELGALADAAVDAGQPAGQAITQRQLHRLDADGRIDIDLSCVQCEYNLRGQLPEGSCPECGLAVAESMRSDRLSQADPRWLSSLRKSTTWLILGGFSYILMGCLNGSFRNSPSDADLLAILMLGINVLQNLSFCVGYWLLTDPEPNAYRNSTARQLARWTSVTGHGLAIPALLLMLVNANTLVAVAGLVYLASFTATFIGFCAALVYLRQLARRVPSRSLARQTTTVLWGWIITLATMVLGFVLLIFTNITGSQSPVSTISLIGMVFCPLAIAILVFLIWWIVLISHYSKCFEQALKAARRNARSAHQADEDFI